MTKYWYRYEDKVFSVAVDPEMDVFGVSDPKLYCRMFRVDHHTPAGVVLDIGRLVLHDSRKKLACPTREEALESYRRRKEAQIKVLEAQLRRARLARALADEGRAENDVTVLELLAENLTHAPLA
jgi:hypothetical protein